MARSGVWNLQQVRDKYLQSDWVKEYTWYSVGNAAQWKFNTTNANNQYSSPIQIGASARFQKLMGGAQNSIYLWDGPDMWVSGSNYDGQLGLNEAGGPAGSGGMQRSSPVQLPGNWEEMDGTGGVVAMLDTDNKLWMWGQSEGQSYLPDVSGLPTSTDYYSSPVLISATITDWGTGKGKRPTFVNSRTLFTIKSDGTLWCWGDNQTGELGLNQPTPTKYSSPKQVGTDTDWSSFDSCPFGACLVLKTDNTLWTWGSAGYGVIATNQGNTPRSSPMQVPGDWSEISCGPDLAGGVKSDGTLWMWGRNNYGQAGHNNLTRFSSPLQVGTDTDWYDVEITGGNCSYGFKTDGSLWSWGNNQSGTLGLNGSPNAHKSSPTQIMAPGTPGIWDKDIMDKVGGDKLIWATNTLVKP